MASAALMEANIMSFIESRMAELPTAKRISPGDLAIEICESENFQELVASYILMAANSRRRYKVVFKPMKRKVGKKIEPYSEAKIIKLQ